MSFLYPRTITIKRPMTNTSVGKVSGYVAQTQSSETMIAENIPASIQGKSAGSRNQAGLPADSKGVPYWRVMTPRGALTDGQVKNHDIVYDDLGNRFQIAAAYQNSLGANFYAEQMES